MTDAIALHRTAMARSRLSRPIALAIDDDVLAPGHHVFDYGCGRGDDIRYLTAAGFTADGWDPVRRPLGQRRSADVVNLGYVLREHVCGTTKDARPAGEG
jgi:DNA phosphorothioation-associated putative methyltransferase